MTIEIPDKTYFKIGEVAKIAGVKPYIIRYWESEFKQLKPTKTRSKQRLFKKSDIELLLVIKKLLYEEKFTIEGARRRIRDLKDAGVGWAEVLAGVRAVPVHAQTESGAQLTIAVDGPPAEVQLQQLRDQVQALTERAVAAETALKEVNGGALDAANERVRALNARLVTQEKELREMRDKAEAVNAAAAEIEELRAGKAAAEAGVAELETRYASLRNRVRVELHRIVKSAQV